MYWTKTTARQEDKHFVWIRYDLYWRFDGIMLMQWLIWLYVFCRVRIPQKHVYYYRSPDHRKNYVMSFAFCFDQQDDIYQFSYCYPYSYTRLQNYLDSIEKKGLDYLQRDLLCFSVVSLSLFFYCLLFLIISLFLFIYCWPCLCYLCEGR